MPREPRLPQRTPQSRRERSLWTPSNPSYSGQRYPSRNVSQCDLQQADSAECSHPRGRQPDQRSRSAPAPYRADSRSGRYADQDPVEPRTAEVRRKLRQFDGDVVSGGQHQQLYRVGPPRPLTAECWLQNADLEEPHWPPGDGRVTDDIADLPDECWFLRVDTHADTDTHSGSGKIHQHELQLAVDLAEFHADESAWLKYPERMSEWLLQCADQANEIAQERYADYRSWAPRHSHIRGRLLPMEAYHHLRNALLTLGTIAEVEPTRGWRYADNSVVLWLAQAAAVIAEDRVINRADAAERLAENVQLWASRDVPSGSQRRPRSDQNHYVPAEGVRPISTTYRNTLRNSKRALKRLGAYGGW